MAPVIHKTQGVATSLRISRQSSVLILKVVHPIGLNELVWRQSNDQLKAVQRGPRIALPEELDPLALERNSKSDPSNRAFSLHFKIVYSGRELDSWRERISHLGAAGEKEQKEERKRLSRDP